MIRKEFGSDFHFVDTLADAGASIEGIYPDAQLCFSGRSALFAIVDYGIEKYGWKKLYLPNYYCNEVIDFVSSLPIEIFFFDDGPYKKAEPDFSTIDNEGNVYVAVNYFGLRRTPAYVPVHAFSIEDHTHDLVSNWAQRSTAHFCFASLRKTLPIPSGGVIWSPKKLGVPDKSNRTSEVSNKATFMKLTAMLLKKFYLEGADIRKQEFRDLFVESEQLLGASETNARLPSISMELIRRFSVHYFSQIKKRNYQCFWDCIEDKTQLFNPYVSEAYNPFGLVYYFNKRSERDSFKSYLIKNNIYPAVLWPNQLEANAADFSERSLLIHCDFRYTKSDITAMSDVINQYQNENKSYRGFGKARME